jgi:hypothetical protein
LIEVLVTPVSVEPLACPLPHGEGSVPNLVVEIADDDAPLATGATATPAQVVAVITNAKVPALMTILLFTVDPHLLFDLPPRGLVTCFSPGIPDPYLVLDIMDSRMTLL